MNEPGTISAEDLKFYTLSNNAGISVTLLNLGAGVFDLLVPDKDGNLVNVVVGPKNREDYLLPEYLQENRCFGSSVGRYAGRISNGKFRINNESFQLSVKDGVHMHGGSRGLQHKLWELESQDKDRNAICFSCLSEAGEEGYPGNLKVQVTYTLTKENALEIEYKAVTDSSTPVNITNHTFFNLNGGGSVSDHELIINALHILEVDDRQLPTGEIVNLRGRPKDFSFNMRIEEQEIDDTFKLEKSGDFAATLFACNTGIRMQVKTNQPAVVIYIPEALPNKWKYKNEVLKFPTICIETQNFPDAPNHKHFPSAILEPGEDYVNFSSYKFSVENEKE